jgi:hypothetical protein
MRIGAVVALLAMLVVTSAACGGGGDLFRQYEYEEEMYLALDGSATIYVNASLPALNALRGTSFDLDPSVPVDRDAVRAYFTAPGVEVTRVTRSRRRGRRFAHVRLDVESVNRLGAAPPFAWSTYKYGRDGELQIYQQAIGAAAGGQSGNPGWTGDEIVAFRMHLPSTVVYHNAGPGNPRRGNILVWEQPLAARLRGEPIALDARFESQSILSRTLLLFAAAGLAVAVTFVVIIWWVMRRGRGTERA